MLVATKINKKRSLIAYSAITFCMLAFSIYLVYNNYINSLELRAPESTLAAYYGDSSGVQIPESEEVEEKESSASKIRKYFNIDIFYDKKYRSLRENSADTIDLNLGKRDIFKSF